VHRSPLLPTDGSEAAEAGLQEGLRLAKALKARVAFLCALEPLGPKLLLGPKTLPYYRELVEDLRREGLAALDQATRWPKAVRRRSRGVFSSSVSRRSPAMRPMALPRPVRATSRKARPRTRRVPA
jgi:nucleotide-binding universal stress UspA family protein